MFEKVITKEALLYFSQQFYSKISNTFARKSHTHTSLANKEHNHTASDVSLNDGRDLESTIKDIESKVLPVTNIILSSTGGICYKLNVDDKGVIYTTLTDNIEDNSQDIVINNFILTIDDSGRLITTKK